VGGSGYGTFTIPAADLVDTGNITVTVTNISAAVCGVSVSDSNVANFRVNPAPNLHNVGGGGLYCAGTSGVHVSLDFSDLGVTYQLYSTPVGGGTPVLASSSILGTSGIDFGPHRGDSVYTVTATTGYGCNSQMNGSATVDSVLPPSVFAVSGGGGYCPGGSDTIHLSGSQAGVHYQLYNNTTPVGSAVAGTGSYITYSGITALGTDYNVVATATVSPFCTTNMSGSAFVSVNPLPAADTMTGGGSYCSGGTGVNIGMNHSQTSVTYTLFRGGVLTTVNVLGSGSAFNFTPEQTIAGTYTVEGTTNLGCSIIFPGSKSISVIGLPSVFTVSGGGAFCAGGPGVSINLSGSSAGITYVLTAGGLPVDTVTGTGSPITFGLHTTLDTYRVVAYNASGCSKNMGAYAVIVAYPEPTLYDVQGGGHYCSPDSTEPHITLDGSDPGIAYHVVRQSITGGAITLMDTILGNTAHLDFGAHNGDSLYSVIAYDTLHGCVRTMNGTDSGMVAGPYP